MISTPNRTPAEFSPALASWSKVKNAGGTFLCVNFNFDGLGHSGSFQKFKGAYLLGMGRGKDKLYYIEGNTEEIRRGLPHQ